MRKYTFYIFAVLMVLMIVNVGKTSGNSGVNISFTDTIPSPKNYCLSLPIEVWYKIDSILYSNAMNVGRSKTVDEAIPMQTGLLEIRSAIVQYVYGQVKADTTKKK